VQILEHEQARSVQGERRQKMGYRRKEADLLLAQANPAWRQPVKPFDWCVTPSG
jgi:hypothetical protein